MENLSQYVCDEVLKRYRQAMDLNDLRCPATEEACGRTLILRHQVLLGEPGDTDDIIETLWKVYKNIDELR